MQKPGVNEKSLKRKMLEILLRQELILLVDKCTFRATASFDDIKAAQARILAHIDDAYTSLHEGSRSPAPNKRSTPRQRSAVLQTPRGAVRRERSVRSGLHSAGRTRTVPRGKSSGR